MNVDTATKKWMWNIYLRVRISSKTYKSREVAVTAFLMLEVRRTKGN